MEAPERQFAPWPAAPGNNATIIMFTTHAKVATGGSAQIQQSINQSANRINAVELVWLRNDQASAANGIRVYALDDTGTFREVDVKDDNGNPTIGSAAPQAVGVLSAGQERRILIDVSRYAGVAIEYTAGATGPTNWNGSIAVHMSAEAIVR